MTFFSTGIVDTPWDIDDNESVYTLRELVVIVSLQVGCSLFVLRLPVPEPLPRPNTGQTLHIRPVRILTMKTLPVCVRPCPR